MPTNQMRAIHKQAYALAPNLDILLWNGAMLVLAGERPSRHHAASETTQGPIDLQLMEGQIHWVTCFYVNVVVTIFLFCLYQLLPTVFLSGEQKTTWW